MEIKCIMCGNEPENSENTSRIEDRILRPLCIPCHDLCESWPRTVRREYPWLFDPSVAKPPTVTRSVPVDTRSLGLANQLRISGLNNRTAIAVGIVVAIIGVALIIISPKLLFVEHIGGGGDIMSGNVGSTERFTDLRNVALFFGVALLIVGGIASAVGFSQFKSTQPTTPPAPTTQPAVIQSVLPKSVELGNTPDEVQSVMGQPDKIINLGPRVIHVYSDMKIIYVDGKVSDVQLS